MSEVNLGVADFSVCHAVIWSEDLIVNEIGMAAL
jgi:hypothetical protein